MSQSRVPTRELAPGHGLGLAALHVRHRRGLLGCNHATNSIVPSHLLQQLEAVE